MFEKEAEEYLKKDGTKAEQILSLMQGKIKVTIKQIPFILAMIQQTFQDGAEFGYNKGFEFGVKSNEKVNQIVANEWHNLRKNPDDLPKDCKGKLYLVNIYSDSQLKFEYAEYTPTVCLWNSEWKRFEILELTVGSRIVNIRSVIAWKEIVLPKLKEGEK